MAIDRERDETAESGRSASMISDHAHMAPIGQPWARCSYGLAAAAHEVSTEPYAPVLPYRCPDCVTTGAEACDHGEATHGHDHACCPPDDCCGGPCAAHPHWDLTT